MRRRHVIVAASLATLLAGSGAAALLTSGTASAATVYSVAPYVDLSAGSADMLHPPIASGGVNSYTAAFVIGSGCTPIWGDTLGIDNSTVNPRIPRAQAARARALIPFRGDPRPQAAGARPITSCGGAGGAELGQSCTNTASLQAAYQSVSNKYKVDPLD